MKLVGNTQFYSVAILFLIAALLQQTLIRVVNDAETFINTAKVAKVAKSVGSELGNRATWVDYFLSRAFWFPNVWNLVTIVVLVVLFIRIRRGNAVSLPGSK
jgi:hypothetical protein